MPGSFVKSGSYCATRVTGRCHENRQRILDIAFQTGQAGREKASANILKRNRRPMVKLKQRHIMTRYRQSGCRNRETECLGQDFVEIASQL